MTARSGDCGDSILTGAHGVAPREDGVADFEAAARVTTHAIDHGTGEPVAVADGGQDVAPHGGVAASAVVDDDHLACAHIVDVVADGAAGRPDRKHAHRERLPDQPEVPGEWHDPQALPRDAEPIEGVGQRRRAVRAEGRVHSPSVALGRSMVS